MVVEVVKGGETETVMEVVKGGETEMVVEKGEVLGTVTDGEIESVIERVVT